MSSGGIDGAPLMPPAPLDGAPDSTGKSLQQIEADIAATRGELSEILDALGRQLAPRRLLEGSVDMLKDTISGDGGVIAETLRSHPIPIALIGMSVGWMLIPTGTRARIGEYGAAVTDRVSGAVQSATAQATALAGQAPSDVTAAGSDPASSGLDPTAASEHANSRRRSGEAWKTGGAASSEIKDTVWHVQKAGRAALRRASDYADQAGERLSGVRDRLTQLIEERPLAVGVLGFIAGCGVALLMRRTIIEERLIGPAADELREHAASFGREAIDRAEHVAERAIDAVAGAAKEAIGSAEEAPRELT